MPKGEQSTAKTGELSPASGMLRCQNCNEEINIEEGAHIPPCPKCAGTRWEMAESLAGAAAGSRGGASSKSSSSRPSSTRR